MSPQPVGAHVQGEDPLAEAAAVNADRIQLFLSNPQGFEKPIPRDDAGELLASAVGIYVHAPYLINVCSPKPNIRHGSRKILKWPRGPAPTSPSRARSAHLRGGRGDRRHRRDRPPRARR